METMIKVNGLQYEEEKWNDTSAICYHTNCYAYAINVQKNPLTNECFTDYEHVQPGNLGSKRGPILNAGMFNFVEKFLEAVNTDLYFLEKEIVPSTFEEVVDEEGVWKVALCHGHMDYHWYRLNTDGTWSHKQGRAPVVNEDDSGEIITNPEYCDRGDYYKFVGFFIIKNIKKLCTKY